MLPENYGRRRRGRSFEWFCAPLECGAAAARGRRRPESRFGATSEPPLLILRGGAAIIVAGIVTCAPLYRHHSPRARLEGAAICQLAARRVATSRTRAR